MKKVVTVTLGPSKKDFEFKTKFLGQEFSVQRLGADKDSSKAWELMRRQQANADAIALSDMVDHYHVGLRTVVNKKSQRLMQVVTRVPVTTGASLRRLLQVRAIRYVQKELGHYFNNNLVLFLSGMRNYDMAVALSDYTRNLSFADPVFHAGSPVLLNSLDQLELFAKGKELIPDIVPGDFLKSVLGTLKNKIVANAVAKSHVIVGTFREIQTVSSGSNLEGKTLITSAVDDEAMAFFAKHKVNLVVDVSPKLFDRVVGISTITAMILAATGKPESELSDHDFEEIIHELDIRPRLLHPTGHFRNIRRFAFVVHPLSQEYIKKGFPLPKGTPKFIMDKVETLAAYMPPMVYCKMSNIVSPSGAEAEGWLISVGGTPKEMLSHSPEFTYRRLLHAAKIAEGLGAQIMGLGAFTKVVGDAGITVARRASIPITTGNSYSASGALWAAADAMRRMGLVKVTKDSKRVPAKTMVIGATGSIGSVSARLLAMAFDEVVIAGRDLKKLNELRDSILLDTPDAKVISSTDYDSLLGDMDMIVTSTSGAGKKILDITKVKPGCVITDVARPLDLPPSEVAKRPDVLVIESGEIELPTQVKGMKSIGLPRNVIYACLAETIVLALEGRFEVFTIGRDTEWEKVKEIYKLGIKHGMKLSAISGVKGVYSDQDIAKVVALARKARLTWKGASSTPPAKPVSKKVVAKKVVAKKVVAKKVVAKKAVAKKAVAKKAVAKKAVATKVAAKKPVTTDSFSLAKKAATTKAAATTAVAKKAPVKSTVAPKKPAAKRAPTSKSAAKTTVKKKAAA